MRELRLRGQGEKKAYWEGGQKDTEKMRRELKSYATILFQRKKLLKIFRYSAHLRAKATGQRNTKKATGGAS